MAQPTPPMFAESQRRCLVLAATFLAGSLIGYWINNRAPSAAGTAATAERKPSQLHASSSRLGDTSRVFPGADPTGDASAHAASDITSAILSATHARDYFQRRHDIYAAGQKLDRTTIRAALDATQTFSEADREIAQYPLIARWLELDAGAAYDWVRAAPKGSRRTNLMREFFHSLGMKDPAAAVTFLQRYQADPERGEDFSYSVFEAWSAHDPAAAVDAVLKLEKKEARNSGLGVAFGRWAKRDPHAALARVTALPDAEMRRSYLKSVLGEWAEEDPQAAASYAMNLPPGKERNDAIAGVATASAAADTDAAMRLIEQIPAGAARNTALSQIVSNLGYKEPRTAARFVLALPPGQQRNSVHQVINGYARQDRAAALDWAGQLASADARQTAMRQIVQQWSEDDPKGAAEYCVSSPLGNPETLGNAVANWARNDASGALAWAGALPDATQREAAVSRALGALGDSDPNRAIALASTMLTDKARATALANIAGVWASKDPAAAAAWVGQLTDASARSSAMTHIAHTWARSDPAAAAAWALQTAGDGYGLSTVTREWAQQDPAAAAKWLETLAPGQSRDSAIDSFAQAVVDIDPEGAVAWAVTIEQPQRLENTARNIYYRWKNIDPKAAAAWLQSTPALSEEAKKNLSR